MDEAKIFKTLDQLIQLDNSAVRTYDLALKTITDPAIREQLEELKARHAHHAGQLSSQILKLAHRVIAMHWDDITSAALKGQQPEQFTPQMRIVSGG